MQSRITRLGTTLFLAASLAAACGGRTEQGREEAAAREFRQRLAQNRADLIYDASSDALRRKMTEAEFRKSLFQSQGLGILEQTERAHYTRTQIQGQPDLIVTFYNSRFVKGSCLESFSWRTDKDALKLESYSCAPNMQVKCTGEASCETSPVPAPGFAGD